MKGIVKIGSTEVGMLANAASPIIYKQLFHKDFLRQMTQLQGGNEIDGLELFAEMGFVMAMQHENPWEEIRKLTEDDYIEWLAQYDPNDVLIASEEIANLYNGQSKTLSASKKEGG